MRQQTLTSSNTMLVSIHKIYGSQIDLQKFAVSRTINKPNETICDSKIVPQKNASGEALRDKSGNATNEMQ